MVRDALYFCGEEKCIGLLWRIFKICCIPDSRCFAANTRCARNFESCGMLSVLFCPAFLSRIDNNTEGGSHSAKDTDDVEYIQEQATSMIGQLLLPAHCPLYLITEYHCCNLLTLYPNSGASRCHYEESELLVQICLNEQRQIALQLKSVKTKFRTNSDFRERVKCYL